MAQETCPQCAGELAISEHSCYLAIHCIAQSDHYGEHRRKPGAPYLWGAEFHLPEPAEQLTLLGGAA